MSSFTLGSALAFVFASFAQSSPTPTSRGAEYERGFRQGQAEALRDAVDGRMSIYSAGLHDPGEWLNRETGLPIRAIGVCSIDASTQGRRDGYNQTIRGHIARDGLPRYSFNRWASDLFDLQSFVERRSSVTPTIRVRTDGPAFVSPDHVWSLRVVKTAADVSELRLTMGSSTVAVFRAHESPVEMELVVGPDDSQFAVLAFPVHDVFRRYVAIDLRRGLVLRSTDTRVRQ
jgi:hypothetical protein